MPLTASVADDGNPKPGASGPMVSAASAAAGARAKQAKAPTNACRALGVYRSCTGTPFRGFEPCAFEGSLRSVHGPSGPRKSHVVGDPRARFFAAGSGPTGVKRPRIARISAEPTW